MDIQVLVEYLKQQVLQRTRIERLEEIVESMAYYQASRLFAEWKQYIEETPTSNQVDWFVYQNQAARQVLQQE